MFGKKYNLIIGIIFTILGLVLSAQFRSYVNINKSKTQTVDEINILKKDIKLEKEKNIKISKEIDETEKKKSQLLNFDSISNRNDNLEQLIQERNILNLKAGLVEVKGPGLTIEISDAAPNIKNLNSQNIIHDFDIVRILNELKKSGAQAITVNDERIISTSEILCSGPTIRINSNRYPSPYVIKTIGEPNKMYDSFVNSDIVALLRSFKIKVNVEKAKDILIPKFYNKIPDLTASLELGDKK